jgi:hypothetical protein
MPSRPHAFGPQRREGCPRAAGRRINEAELPRRFFRQRVETVGERKKSDALQDIILDYVGLCHASVGQPICHQTSSPSLPRKSTP